ncbi:hypothetical protein AB3X93_42130, partial [Paraburkholderia sp. BR14262]|uniref:hypothetical protein n=1 Tax=Paraburkholderia sp. BR14262 TaxID=3236999 RepID=UPI0034CEEA67
LKGVDARHPVHDFGPLAGVGCAPAGADIWLLEESWVCGRAPSSARLQAVQPSASAAAPSSQTRGHEWSHKRARGLSRLAPDFAVLFIRSLPCARQLQFRAPRL